MTIAIDLPQELEKKLSAEASKHGLPLADYVLRVLSNGGRESVNVESGADLVSYWQHEGLLGSRADIADSQQHAHDLREEAERREQR
jgi:hypothetical protein